MEIKYGWMEIMDVLHWLNHNHELATKGINPGIIPMVLIPLTAVTVAVTSLAGIIAGWFGIKLHTEGPKQFLEVLLKKRVLVSMLVLNLFGIGVYKTYIYVKTLPSFMMTIKRHSNNEALASDQVYPESHYRPHDFIGEIKSSQFTSINLEKEIKLNKGAFRSGVISGSSIFYGDEDGFIYEIDKSKLSVKRKFFIGSQVTTRPIIFQNRIYVGEGNHDTHHARIYSFNLKTGKFENSFSTLGHTEGQPIIESVNGVNLLFIAAGSDGLYAIDPISMKQIWHKKDGHLDATVSVENGIVYTGTGVEKGSEHTKSLAVAYRFNTGEVVWRKELPISNWMHPIITQDDVCYSLGEIYTQSSIGMLYCLNKLTGTPHFSIPLNAPLASKPFYIKDHTNEYIFLADFKGELSAIDINKKEKMWSLKTGTNKTNHSFVSFDYSSQFGMLIYPSLDNGLFAIEPKTGKVISRWYPKKNQAKWDENYASVSIEGSAIYYMDLVGNLRKFSVN